MKRSNTQHAENAPAYLYAGANMRQPTYFLVELMKVFVLFSIPGSIICFINVALEKDLTAALPLLLLWLIPLVLIFARHYVKNFFLFALCHLIWIPYLFLPLGIVTRLLAGAFLLLTIVYSYARKYTGRCEEMSMGLLLVGCGALAVLYIFSGYLNAQPVRPYLIGLAFIQLLIYFISMHILNVNHTLSNVEDMMSQPVGKLRRFNGRIAAMYLVIVAVLALAAVLLRLDVVFTWIGSGALALVRWLVSLMGGGGGGGEVPEDIPAPDASQQGDGMGLPAAGDPFIIWVILEKLVFIAFIAAAIVGIVYLLYRFYKAFNKNAVQELATEEFKESSAFVEKEKRAPRAKSNLWDVLQTTPEKKIRRAYFHKISRYMKKGDWIKPADTPLEIEEALKEQQDLRVLTQLYQKARYSKEPITKEEIRDVKT